jgi:hypothetical protein
LRSGAIAAVFLVTMTVTTAVMTATTVVTAAFATPKTRAIPVEVIGWLCVGAKQTRVVIDMAYPTTDATTDATTGPTNDDLSTADPDTDCARGSVIQSAPAKIRRLATERVQGWRRSPVPLRLMGVTGELRQGWLSRFVVRSASTEATHDDRFLASLVTPELPPHTPLASAVAPSLVRAAVFDNLPEFAEAVPSATVRTKRIYTDHRLGYVADVRTTEPNGPEKTRSVSNRTGVPAVATTVSATRLADGCIDAETQVSRSIASSVPSGFGPAIIACDETSQVLIVHARALNMATLAWSPEYDVVLDTAIRVG